MIQPLLNGYWKLKYGTEDTIIGKWFEDDNEYEIKAPPQLIESLIQLQSYFVELYKAKQKAEIDIKRFDHSLFGE